MTLSDLVKRQYEGRLKIRHEIKNRRITNNQKRMENKEQTITNGHVTGQVFVQDDG